MIQGQKGTQSTEPSKESKTSPNVQTMPHLGSPNTATYTYDLLIGTKTTIEDYNYVLKRIIGTMGKARLRLYDKL